MNANVLDFSIYYSGIYMYKRHFSKVKVAIYTSGILTLIIVRCRVLCIFISLVKDIFGHIFFLILNVLYYRAQTI